MQLKYMWQQTPPVTKNLLIINVIVWIALSILQSRTVGAIVNAGALHYFTSSEFLPSQLFTYMFMHEGFAHLFFNMFALFMFGGIIERLLGRSRFLFYYVSCGIGAALIQEGVFALMINHYTNLLPPDALDVVSREGAGVLSNMMNYSDPAMGRLNLLVNIPTLGASGAVYGILLAFGFLLPRQPLYLMFIPVPVQARWVVLGYGALELLQALNANPADNVAHLAHLGGMVFGLLMLLYWKRNGGITRSF